MLFRAERLIFVMTFSVLLSASLGTKPAYSAPSPVRTCENLFSLPRSTQSLHERRASNIKRAELQAAEIQQGLDQVTSLLRQLGYREFVEGRQGRDLITRIGTENPDGFLWYVRQIKVAEQTLKVDNASSVVLALDHLSKSGRRICRGGNCKEAVINKANCTSSPCANRLVVGQLVTGEERLQFESRRAMTLFGLPLRLWVSEPVMMDALTGALMPHGIGKTALEDIVRAAQKRSKATAFIFVDVNDLSKVNYFSNGFNDGNAYISAVGRVLKQTLRVGDTFVRIGGDEFILILDNLKPDEIQLLSQRLINAVASDPEARAVFTKQWSYVETKIAEMRRASKPEDLSPELQQLMSGLKAQFQARVERGARVSSFADFRQDAIEILEEWLVRQKVVLAPNVSIGSTFIRSGDNLDSLVYRASCNANVCKRMHKEDLGADARKYGGSPESPERILRNSAEGSHPLPKALPPDYVKPEEPAQSSSVGFDFRSLYN